VSYSSYSSRHGRVYSPPGIDYCLQTPTTVCLRLSTNMNTVYSSRAPYPPSHPWMTPERYESTNPIVRFLALDHPWWGCTGVEFIQLTHSLKAYSFNP
jgi:hypothetical protein